MVSIHAYPVYPPKHNKTRVVATPIGGKNSSDSRHNSIDKEELDGNDASVSPYVIERRKSSDDRGSSLPGFDSFVVR